MAGEAAAGERERERERANGGRRRMMEVLEDAAWEEEAEAAAV